MTFEEQDELFALRAQVKVLQAQVISYQFVSRGILEFALRTDPKPRVDLEKAEQAFFAGLGRSK